MSWNTKMPPSSFAQCTANPGPASEGRTSLNLFLQFKCFCNDIVFGRWGWMGWLWLIHLTCQWLTSHSWLHAKRIRRVAVTLVIWNTDSAMPDTILTVTDRWSDTAGNQFLELGWPRPGKDAKPKLFPNLGLAYLGLIAKTSSEFAARNRSASSPMLLSRESTPMASDLPDDQCLVNDFLWRLHVITNAVYCN